MVWRPAGWQRLGNTTLAVDLGACKSKGRTKPKPTPGCLPECKALGSRSCQARCGCAACTFCTPVAQQWRTPTGVLLESLTSRTSPSFQFAYNPVDADMDSMKRGLVVEPILTHAWHEATWRCCAEGGRIVDVGGNFGWFTLFSLALGGHRHRLRAGPRLPGRAAAGRRADGYCARREHGAIITTAL